MKSRWFLTLEAIIGLALFASQSIPVAAATPTVKLVLGGTGATPWAVGNIAPGNSGTSTVTLSNTGFSGGVVSIWLSNIVNSEGANPESETGNTSEPGELGDYLLLNVTGTNLSTDFTLPAKIGNFPQNATDTKHIYINPLNAFSALTMKWDWQLPAATGNDVQGDGLSFTINYTLEEFPPLPSVPSSGGGGASASIGMTKTGLSGVFVGLTGSYTMTVTNTGEVALNNVTVTDELPDLLSYLSSSPAGTVTGSRITWNLGALNIGETKEIVVILNGVKSGVVVSTATVTTREGTGARAPLDIIVLSTPGATMSLAVTKDPVAVGDELGYNIQVTNRNGTADLHNLIVTGLIPDQMVFLSATGAAEFTVVGQEVKFKPVAILKPGENIRYQVGVKATTAGAAVFHTTMRCDEFGEPIVDQVGTTVYKNEPPIPPLPPAPVSLEVIPILPAPSETQKVVSIFWLIPIILGAIGVAALIYFLFIIFRRKQFGLRWEWVPSTLPASAINILAQTAGQWTLYASHQMRVAELASAIAREMKLSKKLIKMLLLFGITRETGSVELPYPVAQTALQYHEKLNGSGYPKKQAGDDMLLEARILALADTVETMSAPRPYRPAMDMAKVLAEIKLNGSNIFDSEVFKAFERLVDKGKFRFQTFYE